MAKKLKVKRTKKSDIISDTPVLKKKRKYTKKVKSIKIESDTIDDIKEDPDTNILGSEHNPLSQIFKKDTERSLSLNNTIDNFTKGIDKQLRDLYVTVVVYIILITMIYVLYKKSRALPFSSGYYIGVLYMALLYTIGQIISLHILKNKYSK